MKKNKDKIIISVTLDRTVETTLRKFADGYGISKSSLTNIILKNYFDSFNKYYEIAKEHNKLEEKENDKQEG